MLVLAGGERSHWKYSASHVLGTQEASHRNAPGPSRRRQKGRRHRRSRRTGRFEFRTYLPGDVNADAVNAQLSSGVLTVTIPKSEGAKPRQIEIKG